MRREEKTFKHPIRIANKNNNFSFKFIEYFCFQIDYYLHAEQIERLLLKSDKFVFNINYLVFFNKFFFFII